MVFVARIKDDDTVAGIRNIKSTSVQVSGFGGKALAQVQSCCCTLRVAADAQLRSVNDTIGHKALWKAESTHLQVINEPGGAC